MKKSKSAILKISNNPKYIFRVKIPDRTPGMIKAAIDADPKIIFSLKNLDNKYIRYAIKESPEIITIFNTKKFPLTSNLVCLAIESGLKVDLDNKNHESLVKIIQPYLTTQNSKLSKTLLEQDIRWGFKIPDFNVESRTIRNISYSNIPSPETYYKLFPKIWHEGYYFIDMFQKYPDPNNPYTIKIQKQLIRMSDGEFFNEAYENEIHMSDEVKMVAIKTDLRLMELLINPSLDLQRMAIELDSFSIVYIQNPDPEIQYLACQKDPQNYYNINYEVRDKHLEVFKALIHEDEDDSDYEL